MVRAAWPWCFFGVVSGCAEPAELGVQPSIQASLVIHVEPLPRQAGDGCVDDGLAECGIPIADTWQMRTDNLSWLVAEWTQKNRAIDLQLGPEMAWSWVGEPGISGQLAEELGAQQVAASSGEAVDAIEALLASGKGQLGVHTHAVLPDEDRELGIWGELAQTGAGEQSPCEAWSGDALTDPSDDSVERVVFEGALAAAALVEETGGTLLSFTGHLPRTMAGKVQVVEDPEALDGETTSGFPTVFAPVDLGSAYSECMMWWADHPPFEPFAAGDESALVAGDGPMVIPGDRSAGSMGVHLGAETDSTAPAMKRRIMQLLLNWRVAALRGDDQRPWVHTFHAHLYQLAPGRLDDLAPTAREGKPTVGSRFRGDLLAVGTFLDSFAMRTDWQGVGASDGGGLVTWTVPSQMKTEASLFSYGEPDAPPPQTIEADDWPYLPLVTDRLVNSHLVCQGTVLGTGGDTVEVYGFQRCDDGWIWGSAGSEGSGFSCADGATPDWVTLLVPETSTCVPVDDVALRAGSVDDVEIGAPQWCQGGVVVPLQGLFLEPSSGMGVAAVSCGT